MYRFLSMWASPEVGFEYVVLKSSLGDIGVWLPRIKWKMVTIYVLLCS